MTDITFYNTLSRRKENFVPINADDVRMYVCGPTVYDRAHIGNARPVIVFDVLYRLLSHIYGVEHVTYVRNFTDVDDKINARAAETGRSIREITDETITWYLEDMGALGALTPTEMPRATEYIPPMVTMIKTLIARGHAYAAEGHVLFDVNSDEKYGNLARRSLDDMKAGARVEVAPYKRDPMDFVLWKPSSDDQPGWDSPWGHGRPGWHIECSAMAYDLLGETFDIHGGGNDLTFPHHENEAAQSRCAHPEGRFARYWLHNEMLQVEGRKMSKSLGNFFSVRDLLDQGCPGEVIRLVYLGTHYSKPMDWTGKKAAEAKEILRRWALKADGSAPEAVDVQFIAALSEDLNTSKAIGRLNELFRTDKHAELTASARLLGIDLISVAEQDWARAFKYTFDCVHSPAAGTDSQLPVEVVGWGKVPDSVSTGAKTLVLRWMGFRLDGHWDKADQLKRQAEQLGIVFRSSRSQAGVSKGIAEISDSGIEPDKLEALLSGADQL